MKHKRKGEKLMKVHEMPASEALALDALQIHLAEFAAAEHFAEAKAHAAFAAPLARWW